MTNGDTPIPGALNNVIRIDDERIKGHLDRVVCGTAAARRRQRMVDEEVSEHRPAAGPSDEERDHRLSPVRDPLSQNQMCEKFWTVPLSTLAEIEGLLFKYVETKPCREVAA